MKSTIIKRSVVLDGHKTSVSLETEFWEGLREIATVQGTQISSLVGQIDQDRRDGTNLSSAIRVFLFNHLRADSLKPSLINKEELKDRAADARL